MQEGIACSFDLGLATSSSVAESGWLHVERPILKFSLVGGALLDRPLAGQIETVT